MCRLRPSQPCIMQHTTGRNWSVAFSGRGQENAFRQEVSAGIMACVVGNGEKRQCCTSNEAFVAKVAEKWGFAAIFEPDLDVRILRKLRQPTYGEWAMAGDRRKWLSGCKLQGWPGAIGRREVQVAHRLIARRAGLISAWREVKLGSGSALLVPLGVQDRDLTRRAAAITIDVDNLACPRTPAPLAGGRVRKARAISSVVEC